MMVGNTIHHHIHLSWCSHGTLTFFLLHFFAWSNFFQIFLLPEDLPLEETLNQLTIELQVWETLKTYN